MKQTRVHRMSSDMGMYILRYETAEKDIPNKSYSRKDEPYCEPCNFHNKQIAATHYCKECEEMYCDTCNLKHNSKKYFADHNTVDLKNAFKLTNLCEPCCYNDEDNEATDYCDDCDEYLCKNCKKNHLSQKSTRNHNIVAFTASIKCKNCTEPGNAIKATYFCTDCKEPLCDNCADDHKAMKKTNHHVLSTDMATYVLQSKNGESVNNTRYENPQGGVAISQTVASVGAVTSGKSWTFRECDPCRSDDQSVGASSYCKECDEYFCDECMQYHQAQKENTSHQINICSIEAIMCYICRSLNKKAIANSYCEDCETPEPLCELCARQHLRMKRTRRHRLSEDLSCILTRLNLNPGKNLDLKVHLTKQATDESNKTLASILEKGEDSNAILGQPYSTESKSDSILLQWLSERNLNEDEIYQIMYKENPNGKWKTFSDKESCKSSRIVVNGLKSDTSYIFKVRIMNDSSGNEGPFTKESEIVKTRQSPALGILQTAQLVEQGPPKVYKLPIKENVSCRNEGAKTRKFFLGKECSGTTERTIMIVGATGSGKSTLINGIANYIMGVTWEDPFRFTLINLEKCEQERQHDQARSQTEWVTCYTLHNTISDRVNFSVNLIDTPGFGDTRGLVQDAKIIDQIRELFTATGVKGVATLDAVCFILKAPDARLTTTQKYIFESILSLFCNDIKDNICTVITFADGQRPPVLSGIQALDGIPLPYQTYFTFNNSALYVDNTTNISHNLSPFFWDMGNKSCKTFFDHINKMETKSLTLTSEVLRNRHRLENNIKNLQQEIQVGISKINVLEKEVDLFTRNKEAIMANKNFEYYVDENFQEIIDLTGKGQYTTNCLNCNYTCHEDCSFADDKDKERCVAMNKAGTCTQCPKGCNWNLHKNTPYIIKWVKRKVKKRYDDMKRKYEEATQRTLTQEQVLEEMNQDITMQEQAIQVMLEVIAKLINRLKEIALRPDPMSTVQYIELMIESEKREKKNGFEARIDALEKCKQRSTIFEDAQLFQDRVSKTRKTMGAADVANEILKDETPILGKIKAMFSYKKKK